MFYDCLFFLALRGFVLFSSSRYSSVSSVQGVGRAGDGAFAISAVICNAHWAFRRPRVSIVGFFKDQECNSPAVILLQERPLSSANGAVKALPLKASSLARTGKSIG